MPTLARWNLDWQQLGAAAPARPYEALAAAYAEPYRKYHTLQHLGECFTWLDEIGALAEHRGEVAIALWFHDAIYDTRRSDNESQSADWARREARAAGVPSEAAARIHALVMATRHAAQPRTRDAEVLIDIDLSILGAPIARFDEYERQVREEYAWVPDPGFRRKRREILEAFLARKTIFSTAPMRTRLEAPARENLERSLARLGD